MRARLLNPFCANPIKFIKCQHINTLNPYDQSQLACHIHFITGWLLTSSDDLNTQSQSPDSSPKQALPRAINISKSLDNLANNECEHENSSSGASESDPERISNLPKHFATATQASPPSKPPANKRETPCVWLGSSTMTPTVETIPKCFQTGVRIQAGGLKKNSKIWCEICMCFQTSIRIRAGGPKQK